jgi:predicted O-methyltransferase YrrM
MENYCQIPDVTQGLSKGRNPSEGYTRGWGLQFGPLKEKIHADPVYRRALELAQHRTIQSEDNRMNIFLLLRFYLQNLPEGDIIEFGSWKGGSAIFMAAVAKEMGLKSHIWALDTFEGMPETDRSIDMHRKGDFPGVDLNELNSFAEKKGLNNLTFVKGLFEDTAEQVLARARKFSLVHIDCDIRSACAYCYDATRSRMVDGGYIVFDDALFSTCMGATEVVEDLLIRRDGLNCEQIHPHFVFRSWD